MRRKLSNGRAQRIIDVARDEFAKRGLDGARMDRIAARAGVNKQLLFYYFHSKRGLYQAVLNGATRDLERSLSELVLPVGRPIDRIAQALSALYDFLASRPELVTLITQIPPGDTRPLAPAIKRLVVLLAEGQGLGAVRDDLDPHLTAAQALVLMVGYLELEAQIAASAPPLAADEPALRDRWKDSAVDLLLRGVRAA